MTLSHTRFSKPIRTNPPSPPREAIGTRKVTLSLLTLLFLLCVSAISVTGQGRGEIISATEIQDLLNSGDPVVTLESHAIIDIASHEKVIVPPNVRLEVNGPQIAAFGELEVQGHLVTRDVSIEGNLIIKGTLEYAGAATALRASEGQKISIDGGTIKPKSSSGLGEIKITAVGGDVEFAGDSALSLTPESALEAKSSEGRRGIVTVAAGAETVISGAANGVGKVNLEGGVMAVEGDGSLSTRSVLVDLKPNQEGDFSSEFQINENGAAQLDHTAINASGESDIRVAGQLDGTRSAIGTRGDSDIILEGGGNLNMTDQSQVMLDASNFSVDGFFSSHESSITAINGSEISLQSGGFSSSVDDPKTIQQAPNGIDAAIADLDAFYNSSTDEGGAEPVFEFKFATQSPEPEIDTPEPVVSKAVFVGGNRVETEWDRPSPSLHLDDSHLNVMDGTATTLQALQKRQSHEFAPTLFLDSLFVLTNGAKVHSRGQIAMNGVTFVDSDSTIVNEGDFNMGGNPFFASFPKTLHILGTFENPGTVKNGGGMVNLYNESRFVGQSIESTDGGEVNEGLEPPAQPDQPVQPITPGLPADPPAPVPSPVVEEIFVEIRQLPERIVIEWMGGGQLEGALSINGPFSPVVNALSPFAVDAKEPEQFFRVR